MQRIKRSDYLDWLVRHKDKQIIKVVSGVRRCGKSTLFAIYHDYLLENGMDDRQIIMLNFEDVEYEELSNYRLLYDYVKQLLLPDRMNYIFLDEIQHVEQFEKAVDSLFLKENCDVYITGSNAYFMSGELATQLSGRYVELKMLPLSFKEFCSGLDEQKQSLTKNEKFNLYIELSSFPYVLRYGYDQKEAREYLRDIYNTVLLKDVVARLRVSDVNMLENVTKFLLHNIGNRVSATKIAATLKSQGKSIDQKTVDRYIRGLTDSLMLYEAGRYNIKGKQFLTQQNKYYAADVAIRNTLVRGKDSDVGHILENIVYLELLRRGYEVYVGQLDDGGEVDFVAIGTDGVAYYQVSATTLEEETLKRELAPFRKIADNYPKYLLTLDEAFGTADYDGIQKRNVLDWLLGEVKEQR
ncbi:ATP-binding protein [Lacrimispora amygdalina]|uniref:ATP-binding protein n=1 Tax=Lacrimispora amygdalina TaxID=253257 RepID=A0A3E2NF39_9FIRM|nr:ATP-binding protein [Clostridium indicum]RFZ79573.1 ATP-binding protein [Clostridium indicum]